MKTFKNTSVGLVLPSAPGYSETFFKSKISGLQSNGFNAVVFSVNPDFTTEKQLCKVVYAPRLKGNGISVIFNSALELGKAILFNFNVSKHYLQLQKKDGLSLLASLKSLISNHFILSYKTDWLHFGFGTMALGRENIAQAAGAQMAVSFRGFDHYVYPLKHPNCYVKLFSKAVTYHVLSEGMRKTLLKNGISSTTVHKITPAIDISLFASPNKNIDTLQIVTVARLHWIKGLEYTLEALSILKKQGVDFKYTIIGEGIERERLVFAAYQLGLENNVTFAGKLPHYEVRSYMDQATVYLQYSIQEGFCNAVLEAQAMGLLCVVSDAEGLSENVLNNETGWVVPKRNPELLAAKITEVLALNSVEKNEITNSAVQRVKDEFNIEKQTQEFVDFYKL